MKKNMYCILFVWLSHSLLYAQDVKKIEGVKNKEVLEIYEKYSLRFTMDFWTGSGFTRNFDHKKFLASGFGIDPELQKMLMDSPSSRVAISEFNRESTIGNILYWSGLGAMISDIVLLIAVPQYFNSSAGMATYWGLLGGGLTISLVGVGFIYSSQSKLFEAVWQYNKNLISGSSG